RVEILRHDDIEQRPLGRKAVDSREAGDAVQVVQMRAVDEVLLDLLPDALDRPAVTVIARPLRPAVFGERGDLEAGRRARGMPPRQDEAMALDDRPCRQAPAGERRVLGVGDGGAGALSVERPAMERAADLVALDPAAIAQMRAEMRAICLHQMRLAVAATPQHEVAAERPDRPRRAAR